MDGYMHIWQPEKNEILEEKSSCRARLTKF